MSNTYQLSCVCGQSHAVTVRQAGQTVHCDCGENILVPTLRDLRRLPAADEGRQSHAARPWTAGRGIAFSGGMLLLVVGLAIAGYLQFSLTRFDLLSAEQSQALLRTRVTEAAATDLWQLWITLRENALETRPPSRRVQIEQSLNRLSQLRNGALVLAAVGALCMAASGFRSRKAGI